MDDLESVSLGSDFENPGSLINSSLTFISVQSLSSARGSTPLTKRKYICKDYLGNHLVIWGGGSRDGIFLTKF